MQPRRNHNDYTTYGIRYEGWAIVAAAPQRYDQLCGQIGRYIYATVRNYLPYES